MNADRNIATSRNQLRDRRTGIAGRWNHGVTHWRRAAMAAATLAILARPGTAQLTELVNLSTSGVQANGVADLPQAGRCLSANGRCVAFKSSGFNLVPGDTNAVADIFVRDRLLGTNERVSVDSSGGQANGSSGLFGFTMTPDARFVAFHTYASNLVPGDTNGVEDVLVRDRLAGTTERVNLGPGAVQANGGSDYPSISDDGRYVAFESNASNLVLGDTNAHWDVFVRDRWNGTTVRVGQPAGGPESNGDSGNPSLSADGRQVAFSSSASNLVPGDTNARSDVFVADVLTGGIARVSISSAGIQGDGDSYVPSIAGMGHVVSFMSYSTNLVPGDTNGKSDVFAHDTLTHVTTRVSTSFGGGSASGSSRAPCISADGSTIAFSSTATNLIEGLTEAGIFVRDLRTGITEYASKSTAGIAANYPPQDPSVSADGRYLAFQSMATNLIPNDANGIVDDVLLHDRFASGFSSTCDPGTNGVAPCPCDNKPREPGRGCDNSAHTGGAILAATGIAYLSYDTLAFTTADEKPNATSLLLSGESPLANGAPFGQGVRCTGGPLKRLFVKTASAGSITAPDLGAGDPTISARSAALGSPIQAGVARFFLVYYRDPVVLNGCPATSTFNSTQTSQVCWWP